MKQPLKGKWMFACLLVGGLAALVASTGIRADGGNEVNFHPQRLSR